MIQSGTLAPWAVAVRSLALLSLALGSGCVPDGGRPDPTAGNDLRVLDAEDARPEGGADLETLRAAAGGSEERLRRTAVRALGRLQSPALIADISRHLADPEPQVRAAAAEALAQAVHGTDGTPALEGLLARVAPEDDANVRGALARSIGRLALEAPDRRRASDALVALSSVEHGEPPKETLVGVALGFDALLRRSSGDGLSRAAADLLDSMAVYGADDPADIESAQIRALALSGLGLARRITLEDVERGLADPDPEVRRTPLRYLNALVPPARRPVLGAALADPSIRVALEALRLVSAGPRDAETCDWLVGAAAPTAPAPVRLVALEALARQCPVVDAQRNALRSAASELPEESSARWQPAARALLSLARVDEGAAAALLPRFSAHASPFVRTYAALAAGAIEDAETLRVLAADPSPNVRTAALEALFAAEGHRIDNLLIDQLGEEDPQLLMTVARLLAGSTGRTTVAAPMIVAFERLSAARRETWRDPRRALLERIAELGDSSLAARLRPFLADYDPLVAGDVATLLDAWTGEAHQGEPVPLPRAPPPSAADLAALERTSVALLMQGGGTIVIDLLPDLAPRNVWRFVSLARAGYFDGLAFHRWAPNFVIQGGSPGANEYQGDGPYTRDEVGGSHWRGTVGVSTRGHDTGDGQIFINLVDNVRLDHDYTVFGVVSEGLDVVDAVLEGAVIERAEVRVGR